MDAVYSHAYGNGEIVAAGELGDFADAAEGGAHDNGVVAVLLVVVEDGLDALDTGILLGRVLLLGGGLVPVEDATDKGRDEEDAGLGAGNGLDLGEKEGQVAVDLVLGLEDVGGLDALVGRGNLDEDTALVDAEILVELRDVVSTHLNEEICSGTSYVNDVKGLSDGAVNVKGEASVDLGRDAAGNNGENLLAKLDEESVEGGVDLVILVLAVLLAVFDGEVDELCVLLLLGGSEDEGGVGGGVLRLVLGNGRKVAGVTNDSLRV